MVFVNMGSVGVAETSAPVQSINVPRNESVWMSGYWNNGHSSMNPFIGTGNDYSGVFFMYLPLFDTNSQVYADYTAPENLVPLLGKNASWSATGDVLTVDLNANAKWSDGSAVTSQDVVFSWQAWTGQNKTDTGYKGAGIFFTDLDPAIDHFAAPSTTRAEIHLKTGYEFSKGVYEDLLIGGAPIVPEKVFSGKDDSYTNNWFTDSAIPDANKIVDGPYKPYATSDDGATAVNVRVDNWWMVGMEDTHNKISWRLPEPKYVVSYGTPNNFDQATALSNGQIDLYGSYVANVWNLINGSTKLHTWFEGGSTGNEYFALTSAMNEIAFNYLHNSSNTIKPNYPLDQTWLHKALATAINYKDVSDTAASGYIIQSSATWLDDNQPAMSFWYNPDVAAKWAITQSVSGAYAELQKGAYQNTQNNLWYTLDATPGDYYAFSNQSIVAGNDAGPLNGGVYTATTIGDQDPAHAGINLPIGSWTTTSGQKSDWFVYCVDGWTDHMQSLSIISDGWKDYLGINIRYTTVDYGVMINNRNQHTYQMYYSSLGTKFDATPQNFFQYFVGTTDVSRNVTQWQNANFSSTLTAYSTTQSKALQKAYVDDLQDLLGEVMPAIPVTVNCYWYVYSDVYWMGWPNGHGEVAGKYTGTGEYAARADYVPVTTHWTTDHFGHDLMIINNLVKGTGAPTSSTTSETGSSSSEGSASPWDLSSIIIGLSSFAVVSVIVRRKSKKT
jgi:peptide/nickel transport system substrate-binding protein